MKTIRFGVDGSWSAIDFSDFFRSINYLYSQSVIIELESNFMLERNRMYISMGVPPPFLERERERGITIQRSFFDLKRFVKINHRLSAESLSHAHDLLENEELLKVTRCSYASPGSIDLVGIGQSIGHLKDLTVKLIDVHTQKDERETRNGILEEERKAAALKNLREQIAILKDLDYSSAEIRQIIANSKPAIDTISGLANFGQITSVIEIESNDG